MYFTLGNTALFDERRPLPGVSKTGGIMNEKDAKRYQAETQRVLENHRQEALNEIEAGITEIENGLLRLQAFLIDRFQEKALREIALEIGITVGELETFLRDGTAETAAVEKIAAWYAEGDDYRNAEFFKIKED